jgi:hypothetical protein
MSIPKILRGLLGILGFAIIAVSIVVIGFFHFNPLCGEETVLEKMSPDGRYVAVLMTRNCGATTSYVAHINLRSAASNFRPGFFDGTVKDGEVFTSSKYRGDRFCWSKPHKLSVGYPQVTTLQWREVKVDNSYQELQCQ